MTPFALFVVAVAAPVAVVLVVAAIDRRRRGARVGLLRGAMAGGSALFLACSGLAIAGWATPDALDALPAEVRARGVGAALGASPECGLVPFARVLDVEVRDSPAAGPTLRYTCGLTHLGLPRFSNEATCADGSWTGPGLRDPWYAGSCASARTPGRDGDPYPHHLLGVAPQPLGDGFTVPDGAALIGMPIPLGTVGEQGDDAGWTAYLFVDGDPRLVTAALLSQAVEQGFTPAELPDQAPFAMEGAPVAVSEYAACGVVETGELRCNVAAADAPSGRCMTVDVVRDETSSHARVRLSTSTPWLCRKAAGVAVDPGVEPPLAPATWPAVPGPGEPFGPSFDALTRLTVQEGSRLAGPAIPLSPCGGPVAVLEATDDPMEVLDRYVVALGALVDPGAVWFEEDVAAGNRILRRRVVDETAGGDTFTADLVTAGDTVPLLYLTGCRG